MGLYRRVEQAFVTVGDPPKLLHQPSKKCSAIIENHKNSTPDIFPSEPRLSKSGCRIPDHYRNETSLKDITYSPDRQEIDDCIDHDRATESKLQAEQRNDHLEHIKEFIHSNGYSTVLDVFLDELLVSSPRQKKKIRQALSDGGLAKVL